MGDKSKLTNLILNKGGYVTYGDNNKGRAMGEGNIEASTRYQSRMFSMWKGLSIIC